MVGPRRSSRPTWPLAKHGISFAALVDFDWATAFVEAGTRFDYGEVRLTALGTIGDRLHVLIYTIRRTQTWVISLRRANSKEAERYVRSHSL
jgi:uncharacterized DUF497 family protein